MEFATKKDEKELFEFYKYIIETVNKTQVKLGWNIDIYPDAEFINDSISAGEMCVIRENGRIIAAAVVNHRVNDEYDDIDWSIKEPKEKVATIHTFAVMPDSRGGNVSGRLLNNIAEYCKEQGDLAIHLDVIDTNTPAYNMYMRNGYKEIDCIKMFYESVGIREFWMLEKIL